MKASEVRISVEKRAFIQEYCFGQEDGMPEGYTLWLEHTDKPEDPPQGTVYKDGDWGCWGPAPEELVIQYHEESNGRIVDKSTTLDAPTALSWLDILDGIVLYSSTGYRRENFVLYNVKTEAKKTVTACDYIKVGDWDDDAFDHFREPTLWVQDDIIYVFFEAVDGFYDGGENCGKKYMCFKKDTLEQLAPKDCPLGHYDISVAIDENRGKEYMYADGPYKHATYNINLYPGRYNKYGKEEISEMCHKIEHGEKKYPEFPKSLIKQMRKIRLEYAIEIGAEIEPYSLRSRLGKDIWEKLYDFSWKLQSWSLDMHNKKCDRRRERAKTRAARKKKK